MTKYHPQNTAWVGCNQAGRLHCGERGCNWVSDSIKPADKDSTDCYHRLVGHGQRCPTDEHVTFELTSTVICDLAGTPVRSDVCDDILYQLKVSGTTVLCADDLEEFRAMATRLVAIPS